MSVFRLIVTGAARFGLVLAMVNSAVAQDAGTYDTSAGAVNATVLAKGLNRPWGMAFLPNGNLLVTERGGGLRVVNGDGEMGPPIAGVPEVVAQRQGGLLDVHVDSSFADSGLIFLSFSEKSHGEIQGGGSGTAVIAARLSLAGLEGELTEQKVIFRMNNFTQSGLHFGSRIVEGRDGNLWVTLGDRGEMDRAQDPFDLAGGVVRIAKDGSIPNDNPFADGQQGDPAFWSIGHRNPQGATLGRMEACGQLSMVQRGETKSISLKPGLTTVGRISPMG